MTIFQDSHHFGSLWWQSLKTAITSAVFDDNLSRQPSLRQSLMVVLFSKEPFAVAFGKNQPQNNWTTLFTCPFVNHFREWAHFIYFPFTNRYSTLSICLCLSLSINIYLYLSLSVSVYLYLLLFLFVPSISIYQYLSLFVSICLCVSLSVSVYL